MVKKGDLKKRAKKVADEGKKKDEKKEDEEMEISSDECVEQDSKSSPKMDVCPKKKEPINQSPEKLEDQTAATEVVDAVESPKNRKRQNCGE